jgi:hypothetical protein
MSKAVKSSFHEEHVLNLWMMGFFKGDSLHGMKEKR